MFQRLKGAIDSRIAEEQARQRSAAQITSPSRSGSTSIRTPLHRNLSPSQRSKPRPRERVDQDPEKCPDPSEFDTDSAGVESHSEDGAPKAGASQDDATEQSTKEQTSVSTARAASAPGTIMTTEEDGAKISTQRTDELPAEVRVKLRKLEKLENRHQDLLKAYRSAHARVKTIEPFEASLRENTPLTSIRDPGALLEYLNQINLKSDMVLGELKRVTEERDDYRDRFEKSEKDSQALKLELSKQTAQESNPRLASERLGSPRESHDLSSARESDNGQPVESSTLVKSPTTSTSSRIPSFSLFSPKNKPIKSPQEEKDTSEEFFSFDSELPRLEAELQEKRTHIDSLERQVSSLQGDLAVARESTEGMVQSLEAATQELHGLRETSEKDKLMTDELQIKVERLEQEISSFTPYRTKVSQNISGLESKISDMSTELEQKNRAEEQREIQSAASETAMLELREEINHKDGKIKRLEDSLALARSSEQGQAQKSLSASASQKQVDILNGIMGTLRSQLKAAEGEIMELKEIKSKAEDKIEDLVELKAHNDSVGDARLKLADEAVNRYQADAVELPSTKYFGFVNSVEYSLSGDMSTAFQQFSRILKTTRPELFETLVAAETGKDQAAASPEAAIEANEAMKKGKKKRKKNKISKESTTDQPIHEPPAKVTETLDDEEAEHPLPSAVPTDRNFEKRIKDLESQLEGKAATVKHLSTRLRDQDALNEEIETLRDDLLHQGEEHVEARDALKTARLEKSTAEENASNAARELTELKVHHATRSAEFETTHRALLTEIEDLKTRCAVLQKDLAAADQLAASRFKDVTDLRELLSKAQPELRTLRLEVEELRPAKESLKSKVGDLTRLEVRHEGLKGDLKNLSKRISDKDIEIKDLQQKLVEGHSMETKAEEELMSARSEFHNAQLATQLAKESEKQSSAELLKVRTDLNISMNKIQETEEAISKHLAEIRDLRDELSVKTSLHESSQAVLTSLREQTLELGTQAREASTKANALEEELAESQRMLSERSREGEMMRRLLADAEDRAASKIRDLKERMETAIEERERVEDEASASSRRLAREIDDLRNKIREVNRSFKAAEDEKDELARSHKELKRKREQLDASEESARAEAAEAQIAVRHFREALDQREREASELERQKMEIRRMLEDLQEKFELLQKANKALTDDLKSLQQQQKASLRPSGFLRSDVPSSRSSIESSGANVRNGGATGTQASSARDRLTSNTSSTTTGPSPSEIDYVYLKNVLLQFLEQRDKGLQKQLIPVLGMLLNFDRKDEQKWMAAVAAR